jgi:hypothetical protein
MTKDEEQDMEVLEDQLNSARARAQGWHREMLKAQEEAARLLKENETLKLEIQFLKQTMKGL